MEDSRFKVKYAIIVAAGKGSRMGIEMPKQLLSFDGSTVLETAVRAFSKRADVDGVVIVSPKDGSLDDIYKELAGRLSEEHGKEIIVARGGTGRSDSVACGLAAVSKASSQKGIEEDDVMVMIHDAARPGISEDIITACAEAMEKHEAVAVAVPSTDSVRMIFDAPLKGEVSYPIITSAHVDRSTIFMMQTPQCFKLSDIRSAYVVAALEEFAATDDASVAEHAGIRVALVKGSSANKKITTKEDIHMATRIGSGYDVHRLVPGRPLILLGTPIPAKLGLDGHSDADVAAHALMDALLGAAALGDIGRHFPDTDDKYKGADSMKLLAEVKGMLGGAKIVNVDITIIAQAPKLAPYIDQMKNNVAETLGIPCSAVNVKATTEEGLGFTGRGEGIAAQAVCAIEGSF